MNLGKKTPRTRLTRLIGKLLLIAFGLFCGCAVAEITLRVAGYSYPEFYQPDESRGYALRPAKQKPPDTVRIAVMGDSYPEAFPVPLEDAFWSVMGKKLEECGAFGSKKIEVINFGVSGFGTAQELITLREQVWDYSPDIVLLAVTTNNDVSDNLRLLKKTDEVPYFSYREGKLTLDDSFKATRGFRWRQSAISRFGRWIRDHSRLIQAINQGHHGFKIWLAARRARQAPVSQTEPKDTAAASEELGIDNVIYRKPIDQTWNDAWRVTEDLMVQMRDEVKTRGARFVVVTLSNGIQVYPDPNVRQIFMNRLAITDLFYPDNRIKALCEREQIPVITLAPQMQAYAEQNKGFLHGFGSNLGNGHWNLLGQRVAGEAIAQKLCGGLLN